MLMVLMSSGLDTEVAKVDSAQIDTEEGRGEDASKGRQPGSRSLTFRSLKLGYRN